MVELVPSLSMWIALGSSLNHTNVLVVLGPSTGGELRDLELANLDSAIVPT